MSFGVRHTGIVVCDMEKQLQFYQELCGLTVVSDEIEQGEYLDNMLELKNGKVRIVKLTAERGGMVELLQYLTSPGRPNEVIKTYDVGVSHIALNVTDLEKTFEEFEGAGVAFNAPPQSPPGGKVRVTYCKDFEGNFVELVQEL